MKIIFLDIDGVLNSHQSAYYFSQKKKASYKSLCPIACSNLRKILSQHSDCKIVISSSWRNSHKFEVLKKILNKYFNSELIIGKTDSFGIRGDEIKKWLEDHKDLPISHFIILDDDSDMGIYLNSIHFIQTSSKVGLMWNHVETILKYFGNYNLTFKDLVIGQQYKLFSKPETTIYTFDGKGFFYMDKGEKHDNVFFYPEFEAFCLVTA